MHLSASAFKTLKTPKDNWHLKDTETLGYLGTWRVELLGRLKYLMHWNKWVKALQETSFSRLYCMKTVNSLKYNAP